MRARSTVRGACWCERRGSSSSRKDCESDRLRSFGHPSDGAQDDTLCERSGRWRCLRLRSFGHPPDGAQDDNKLELGADLKNKKAPEKSGSLFPLYHFEKAKRLRQTAERAVS